jgi:Polyketide cyclase / dehydrase and lipid transport
MRLPAALTAGLCLCLAADAPEARASESREFSSQEEAELRAGKLVVRAEQRTLRGAHLIGGMSWQVIDAPPDDVFRELTDVRAYPHFLPAVEEARLLDVNGPNLSVFIHHRLGFVSASYRVRAVVDAAHRTLRFRMDHEHPSSIRDAWGELHVSAYGNHQSVASLAILADLGEGMLLGLVRSNVHEWMLRVPQQLKRHVEKQRAEANASNSSQAL